MINFPVFFDYEGVGLNCESKVCTKCKVLKSMDEFGKTTAFKDGKANHCKVCISAAVRKRKEANPEKHKERMRRYYKKKTPSQLESNRKYQRKYRERNPEKAREAVRKVYREHPYRFVANSAKRRANRNNRTPDWLAEEDHAFIAAMHQIRKRVSECTGILFHVDHVIPLKGKEVSGLHVPWNLQIIPAYQNLSKGNRLE